MRGDDDTVAAVAEKIRAHPRINLTRVVAVYLRLVEHGPWMYKPIGGSDHYGCSMCGVMSPDIDGLRDLKRHEEQCLYRCAVEALG